jgi:hypothetical protein
LKPRGIELFEADGPGQFAALTPFDGSARALSMAVQEQGKQAYRADVRVELTAKNGTSALSTTGI